MVVARTKIDGRNGRNSRKPATPLDRAHGDLATKPLGCLVPVRRSVAENPIFKGANWLQKQGFRRGKGVLMFECSGYGAKS